MVKHAYRTRQNFSTFVKELEGIEKEVNRAASQTAGTASAPDIVSRMEETAGRLRAAQVETIFGPAA